MVHVVDKVDRVVKQFGNVKVGDTFRYADSVYIRIKQVGDSECDQWNAVCLTDGDLAYFRAEDRVEPIEIEATILREKS